MINNTITTLSNNYYEYMNYLQSDKTLFDTILPNINYYGGELFNLSQGFNINHNNIGEGTTTRKLNEIKEKNENNKQRNRKLLPYYLPDDHGTSHISIIDNEGNAVAITTTINTYFGSKVMSKSTGILFNNQMDDFSKPGETNYFGLVSSPYNYPEVKILIYFNIFFN